MEKHFIIYRTTNVLNGRYYIGMHETHDLGDGYLGSGRRIKAEINKYGKEQFIREVLQTLPTRQLMLDTEKEIVNLVLMLDPLCLNLKNGGEGGGKFWSTAQHKNASISGNRSSKRNHTKISRKIEETKSRNGTKSKWTFFEGMLGKNHTVETKDKMSVSKMGPANNRFGTVWITNGEKSLSIRKELLDEYLALGFQRGRKMRV